MSRWSLLIAVFTVIGSLAIPELTHAKSPCRPSQSPEPVQVFAETQIQALSKDPTDSIRRCLTPDRADKVEAFFKLHFEYILRGQTGRGGFPQGGLETKESDALFDLQKFTNLAITKEELSCLGFQITLSDNLIRSEVPRYLNHVFLAFSLLAPESLPITQIDVGHEVKVEEDENNQFRSLSKQLIYLPRSIYWMELPKVEKDREIKSPYNPNHFAECAFQSFGALKSVLHEYAHAMDYSMTSTPFAFNSDLSGEWGELHRGGELVTFYSESDYREDFAESFAHYMTDPIFKCYAPRKHQYLSKLIHVNQTIYGSPIPFESVNCADSLIQDVLKRRSELTEKYRSKCVK